MLISSVVLSSYVTFSTPPDKFTMSPCSYVVLLGFVFTDIEFTVFPFSANPSVAKYFVFVIYVGLVPSISCAILCLYPVCEDAVGLSEIISDVISLLPSNFHCDGSTK